MAHGLSRTVCLVAVSLAFTSAAPAQTDKPVGPDATPGAQIFLKHLKVDAPIDGYLENLQREFYQLDADSNGKLNEADIRLHDAVSAARARASVASTFMGFDLNGDGVVTENEVRTAVRYMARVRLGPILKSDGAQNLASVMAQEGTTMSDFHRLDADKDGKLNYVEASNFRATTRRGAANRQPDEIQQILSRKDGKQDEIALDDFVASGEAFFRRLDTDRNGSISQQELMTFWNSSSPPAPVEKRTSGDDTTPVSQSSCALPPLSDKAKLVFLTTYETQALSSVTIGSQDVAIHAGRVVVEAGEDPLYVVIPTYAGVIWQFSGAVDRIERLILTSSVVAAYRDGGDGSPLVGATGLAADRVLFFPPRCGYSFFESSSALKKVKDGLGRAPITTATAYTVIGFSIPSGKITAFKPLHRGKSTVEGSGMTTKEDTSNIISRAGPSLAKEELDRYSPAGVINIDAKSVVSSRPVQPYVVLPQRAGLVQLLEEGALKEQQRDEFIIQKKMRFPAGLHGAHTVKFTLPRGVEAPDGDPGYSCVMVEGSSSTKERCLSGAARLISRR